MINHGRLIPLFIESRSPSGLQRLMIKTNIKQKGMVKYFDIQSYQKKGKMVWIAWYYAELNKDNADEILSDKVETND